jgi:prepilin-type N-terminal cleavage/methylation domain-containing protein
MPSERDATDRWWHSDGVFIMKRFWETRLAGQVHHRDEGHGDQGFSLIEMMVATAISLVVLSIVLVAVIEGQRSINTIASRTADSNAAQPYMDQMALDTRGATEVSVLCPTTSGTGWSSCTNSGTGETSGSMLLTYHVGSSVSYSGYTCEAWFINGSDLEYTSWAGGTGDGTTLPTPSNPTVELTGLQSGSFGYFQSYTGLVDISISVLSAGSASGSGSQQESSPSALETQVDNAYSVQSVPPGQC